MTLRPITDSALSFPIENALVGSFAQDTIRTMRNAQSNIAALEEQVQLLYRRIVAKQAEYQALLRQQRERVSHHVQQLHELSIITSDFVAMTPWELRAHLATWIGSDALYIRKRQAILPWAIQYPDITARLYSMRVGNPDGLTIDRMVP